MRGALLICVRAGDDIVTAHEGTIGEVDSGAVIEIDCHLGELVLLGGRASDEGINQFVQLLGAKGRFELQRSA